MLRSKLGLLGLCAIVLGMMAMSAGAAQAALSWLVLNSAKTTATELKAQLVGKNDSFYLKLLTKLLGKNFEISCTNFELVGVNLEAGGTLTTGGKLKFTGCEAYSGVEPLGCKVHSAGAAAGTVESNKVKGTLVLIGEVMVQIQPETGETLGTFLTEGCVMPESNPVKGVLYVRDCEQLIIICDINTLVHKVEHLIVPDSFTSLYIGSHSAEHLQTSIDGSVWVKLGGAHAGLSWSAMDA